MKKVVIISILSVFIFILITMGMFFCQLIGNNVVSLKTISNEDKKIIIDLMSLSDVSNNIRIEKIETPKTYKDKYYKVYFEIDKDQAKIKNTSTINNNICTDFEEIKTRKDIVKYCCTISAFGDFETLDNIMKMYK